MAGQGGAAAASGMNAGAAGLASGGSGGACAPQPLPDGVPADWREFTDWSCDCRFYVPGDTGTLPDPIVWEPCGAPLPSSLDCQWMAHPWNPKGASFGLDRYMTLDPSSQKPLLWFSRGGFPEHPAHTVYVFAEADGPVRAAYLSPYPRLQGCDTYLQKSGGDHFAIKTDGETFGVKDSNQREGVIGGSLQDPYHPLVLRFDRSPSGLTANWYASQSTLGGWTDGIRSFSWDGSVKEGWIYDPQNDLPFKKMFGLGDDFFLELGSSTRAVQRWSPATGLTKLLGYPVDNHQGWGNFGTDGHDMVWTHGKKQDTGGIEYDSAVVETAPFSLDADTLKATTRTVTKDLKGPGLIPFTVGCGYAARAMSINNVGNSLFIVRLSDGMSWTLPGDVNGSILYYDKALGITCDEIFVSFASTKAPSAIARIKLSSLGPGTPPP